MTPYELAFARNRTYHLFGRLFLHGLNAELLPHMQAVPELAQAAGAFDPDQAAADHYQFTAVSVFPYESIFRDPSGLLGGDVSDRITAVYHQNGYDILSDADHIGHELTFLAQLCAAEAQSWRAGNDSAALLWHSRQQAFLVAHLLDWLPPLVVAAEQGGSLFYGRLANLTLDLAADHAGKRPDDRSPMSFPSAPQFAGEKTGLKEIARYLTTPPLCGIFLSRDAISDLARRHSMPRGFGDRVQMLSNLLRTAGQYDAAAAVIADLSALFSTWSDCYTQQQDAHPDLLPWIRPWRERVDKTAGSLNEITAAIVQSLT